MKTYAMPDIFDEGEVECRKNCNDPHLDGVKVFGGNLIDKHQAYIFIQDEDGQIVSTILNLQKLGKLIHNLLEDADTIE